MSQKQATTTDRPQLAPATTLPVDEWHGVGGEYEMVEGVRRRVGGPPLPEVPPAADDAAEAPAA